MDSGLNVAGTITAQGKITPKEGSSSSDGIEWPANSDGGAGDQGWIRYYGTSGNGVLEVGAGNDGNDKIVLKSAGDIEMQGKVKALGSSDLFYSPNYDYTAKSDGFVVIKIGAMHSDSWVKIYIGGDEHMLFHAGSYGPAAPQGSSYFVPVAKGDVWKVVVSNVDSYEIRARYLGIPYDSE